VSAIAAASTNNGVGVAGVDWGANILPVKVLDAAGNGTYANIAAGIAWATDHGAQVINMSFGGANPSATLENAVNYAFTHGVIQVAATGNTGSGSVYYPAAYAPVIAVAATDSFNSWAGFSNYGTGVTVAAPGVQIYSANLGGGYILRSGTSMAAPHVAGLAAILRGIPGNGPDRVRTIIQSTALDLGAPGWDPYFGYGLIQMDAAIQLAWPTPTPTFAALPVFTATSAGYWPWFPTPTRTPTRTSTPTTTLTLTPSVMPSITLTTTSTQIATESYESLATPTASAAVRTVSLPWWSICGGGAFITAGGLLTWVTILLARSRRRRRW
jgi:subtilisin family serine protease